jgi:hypothetical protein
MEWEGCVVSDFVKTMRNWKRMCNAFVKQYDNDCCKYCRLDHLKSCGAIWEIEEGTYGNIAETVDAWAAENPEPVYPTFREWLIDIGVISDMYTHSVIADKIATTHIPADIAEKLGLKPKGGNETD